MKKPIIFLGMLLLVTGCQDKQNVSNPEQITYTNKFECSREETKTNKQVYYLTKQNELNASGKDENALKITTTRSYDFDKDGTKLLAYYDITTYEYLIDYDMEAQKKYFQDKCQELDKDTYKSCNVSLKNKTITVISEVNLNSEESKEYLSTTTIGP